MKKYLVSGILVGVILVSALVIVVQYFHLGIFIDENKEEEATSDISPAYRNDPFGIEFQPIGRAGENVLQKNNRLESPLSSGSITRYKIEQGKSFTGSLEAFIEEQGGNIDRCDIRLYPWMPNSDSIAARGQIVATINVAHPEKLEQRVKSTLKISPFKNNPEEDDEVEAMWAEITLSREYAVKDCSAFVNTSEQGGHFLYEPRFAPNRFYFVERTSKAGDPNFYEYGTIRILPD